MTIQTDHERERKTKWRTLALAAGALTGLYLWWRKSGDSSRAPLSGYRKRTYSNLGEIIADISFMFNNRGKIRQAMQTLDPTLVERLMLAVTQVNDCRYCSQYHAQLALRGGLGQEEINAILNGTVDHCPPQHATAILYAQHWADTDGHPDPEARRKLVETYGADQAAAIEVPLHMIKMGNYMGNTFDYLLHRLSGGRWGQ